MQKICVLYSFSDSSAVFRFFDLPAEIRNQIYGLVIPRSHVLVKGGHPQKEFANSQKKDRIPMRKHPCNRLSGQVLSLDMNDADPLLILRVCRQFNREATPIFYSKTTICFENVKTVRKFLNTASTSGLPNVRSLRLKVNSYGAPYLTKDCQWKERWDRQWEGICARIGDGMTGLRRLELDLRLATWPTQLSRTADWHRPLMKLKGDGLHSAKVKLRHYRFHETRLDMAARKVEDRMMTSQGREERDMFETLVVVREMERKASIPPRAKKVLVIKGPPKQVKQDTRDKQMTDGKNDQGTPSKPCYRTQGLADFHRVNLDMVTLGWRD